MGRARHSVRAAPVNRSVELLDGSHGVTSPTAARFIAGGSFGDLRELDDRGTQS